MRIPILRPSVSTALLTGSQEVGGAADGFFNRPYLLWFVAEDPVRKGRVPDNVAAPTCHDRIPRGTPRRSVGAEHYVESVAAERKPVYDSIASYLRTRV